MRASATIDRRPERSRPTHVPPPMPQLLDLCFGRSGDKGDAVNVGLIARDPAHYDWLRETVTAERGQGPLRAPLHRRGRAVRAAQPVGAQLHAPRGARRRRDGLAQARRPGQDVRGAPAPDGGRRAAPGRGGASPRARRRPSRAGRPGGRARRGSAPDRVDPALVDALAELHLADARAALDSAEARRPALADSLRRSRSTPTASTRPAWAPASTRSPRTPDLARATYDSVEATLVRERRGPRGRLPRHDAAVLTSTPSGLARPPRLPVPPRARPRPDDPSPETVQVFTTGGTIDKEYFDAKSAYEIGEPQIAGPAPRGGRRVPGRQVEALMRKDSLDLTDDDRRARRRARAGDAAPARDRDARDRHDGRDGPDGRERARGRDGDTTVVFVGSLAPARFKATDAEFNVGFAAAAVQTLPPGAYVAMNGCVFDPHHVRKDRERNRFEPVTPGA